MVRLVHLRRIPVRLLHLCLTGVLAVTSAQAQSPWENAVNVLPVDLWDALLASGMAPSLSAG